MRRRATAYERRGIVYLHSDSQTEAGLWIAGEPFIKIDFSSDPEELGAIVLEAVAGSKTKVPHPQQHEWKDVFKPVLRLAKVRSSLEFERDTRCCAVEIDDEVVVTPYRKSKPGRGFEEMSEKQITLSRSSTPADIGRALVDAFALCK